MEPGQQYWPETRPDPGLTDPWPVSTRLPGWPGNVYAPVNIIYSNLAPRPRPYNLSLMNIVKVSAGNISTVYYVCIQHSRCFVIRHDATTKNMDRNCSIAYQTRWQWQRTSRQKVHFCSAESGSKDRVMCIGHWPVTRPDPAQNVDPATRWPVTRTTRFHLWPTDYIALHLLIVICSSMMYWIAKPLHKPGWKKASF